VNSTPAADDATDDATDDSREHLIVLPERELAESLADDLEAEGLPDVRVVREALAGEDDSEAHEWAVYVRTPSDPAYAVRFEALAAAHDGWYDPDPRD
jgi:precorrin-6B methylase 1